MFDNSRQVLIHLAIWPLGLVVLIVLLGLFGRNPFEATWEEEFNPGVRERDRAAEEGKHKVKP